MFARQGPKVRNACEECHSRKTRCVIGPQGGACVACKANSRECYFKPRSKSGRPYSASSSQSQERNNAIGASNFPNTFETNADAPLPETSDFSDHQDIFKSDWFINSFGPVSQENGLVPSLNNSRIGASRSDDIPGYAFGVPSFQRTSDSHNHPPSFTTLSEVPSPLQSPTSGFCQNSDFSSSLIGGQENSFPSSPIDKSASFDSMSSHTYSLPLEVNYPRPRRELSRSTSDTSRGGILTLEHCIELQQELESTHKVLYETNEAAPHDEVLQTVSATMSLTCERISTTMRGCAARKYPLTLDLALLAIFMIRKALDLSSIFTKPKFQKSRSLDYALFLKRLECNVMELHISFSQIKQQQPALMAVAEDGLKGSASILHQLQEIATETRQC